MALRKREDSVTVLNKHRQMRVLSCYVTQHKLNNKFNYETVDSILLTHFASVY
jgi:hypothetical protein